MGVASAPETTASMATMARGSERRVHAQLSFKLQLLSLLVADTDSGGVEIEDQVSADTEARDGQDTEDGVRAAGRLWGGEAGDDQGTRPSPEGTHARSVAHRISCSFTTSLVTTTRTRDRQPRSHVSRGTSSRPKWTWLSLCVHSCRSTAVWATCPSSLQEAAAPHQLGPPASFPALLGRRRAWRVLFSPWPKAHLASQPLPGSHPPPQRLTPRAQSWPTTGSSGGSSSTGAWCGAHG